MTFLFYWFDAPFLPLPPRDLRPSSIQGAALKNSPLRKNKFFKNY